MFFFKVALVQLQEVGQQIWSSKTVQVLIGPKFHDLQRLQQNK